MLGAEEVSGESESGLPPGFRFHPTDEELITFYLASKVFSPSFNALHIAELDLNRCEPWELPEVAKMGEREWYFFSLRDRKYPTGVRTNRATGAGYWKATGKDRQISNNQQLVIGMKKTLVFYKGRAPRGEKTKWVMHEYRLHGHFSLRHTSKDEWVICRIYHKSGDKKNPLFQGRLHNPTTSITNSGLLLDDDKYPLIHMQNLLQLQTPFSNYNNNLFDNINNDQYLLPLAQPTSFSPPRNSTASIIHPLSDFQPQPLLVPNDNQHNYDQNHPNNLVFNHLDDYANNNLLLGISEAFDSNISDSLTKLSAQSTWNNLDA